MKEWLTKPKDIGLGRLRLTADAQSLNSVTYRNGDVFISNEDKEEVMIDTVLKVNGVTMINLVSMDKSFQGEPIIYQVSEQTLKEKFTISDESKVVLPSGNYQVTCGD